MLQVGDHILVKASCWSGYRKAYHAKLNIETIHSPNKGIEQDQRCVFRSVRATPFEAVFVGWSWLQIGVRHDGHPITDVHGVRKGYDPPYFVEHGRVKVARCAPTGTRYIKPFAALPKDIEHIKES